MRLNIYDIAKEAGVSISSVSRVLNNKENITPEIRAKVEPVLKKYNYKANAIARGLVKQTMRTVAVLTVDIRVSHYGLTIYAIEQAFSKKGYRVIVCNTIGDLNKTLEQMKNLLDLHVDGLIFVGSTFVDICNSKEFKQIIGDVKYVVANGKTTSSQSISILVDDIKGVSLSVDTLIENGCKNIYYIKDLKTESSLRKLEGFKKSASIIGCENNILNCEYGIDGGIEIVEKLLASNTKFDGLIFGEDLTAVGAIQALNKHQIKIPENVQVIGYNNSDYSRISYPTLTSIDNKPDMVGNLCSKLLIDLLSGEPGGTTLTLDPTLIVRESTKS